MYKYGSTGMIALLLAVRLLAQDSHAGMVSLPQPLIAEAGRDSLQSETAVARELLRSAGSTNLPSFNQQHNQLRDSAYLPSFNQQHNQLRDSAYLPSFNQQRNQLRDSAYLLSFNQQRNQLLDSAYLPSFNQQRNQLPDSTYLLSFNQQRNQLPDSTYLQSFNQQRMHTTQTAMIVLGGWAVANIATGLIAMGQTNGEAKYFHQMNAIWNVVNLGIATAGYLGSRKLNGTSWNMPGSIKEQNKIEKIYLVNGALDVAYILGGLYAREYGKNQSGKEQDRWKGYGSSIILQGGFLLLYDAVNLTIHHRHGKGLYQKFENVQVSFSPGSVVAGVRF